MENREFKGSPPGGGRVPSPSVSEDRLEERGSFSQSDMGDGQRKSGVPPDITKKPQDTRQNLVDYLPIVDPDSIIPVRVPPQQNFQSRAGYDYSKVGRPMPFPFKLHFMLEDVERSGKGHAVSWMPSGQAFRVHDPSDLVTKVVPLYFNLTKYKSFKRQLMNYGFARVESVEGGNGTVFSHRHFLRSDPDKCRMILRDKSPLKSSKAKAQLPVEVDEKPTALTRSESWTEEAVLNQQQQRELPEVQILTAALGALDQAKSQPPRVVGRDSQLFGPGAASAGTMVASGSSSSSDFEQRPEWEGATHGKNLLLTSLVLDETWRSSSSSRCSRYARSCYAASSSTAIMMPPNNDGSEERTATTAGAFEKLVSSVFPSTDDMRADRTITKSNKSGAGATITAAGAVVGPTYLTKLGSIHGGAEAFCAKKNRGGRATNDNHQGLLETLKRNHAPATLSSLDAATSTTPTTTGDRRITMDHHGGSSSSAAAAAVARPAQYEMSNPSRNLLRFADEIIHVFDNQERTMKK